MMSLMDDNQNLKETRNKELSRMDSVQRLLDEATQDTGYLWSRDNCRTAIKVLIAVSLVSILSAIGYYYGPIFCVDDDGKRGTCVGIFECPLPLHGKQKRKQSPECDSSQVCCIDDKNTTPYSIKQRYTEPTIKNNHLQSTEPVVQGKNPEAATPLLTGRFPEPTSLEDNINENNDNINFREHNKFNEILKNNKCTSKNRRRSSDRISTRKCYEYQEKYVYPCVMSPTPFKRMLRTNNCNWEMESLIIDGDESRLGEFPHMVLLGYPKRNGKWLCGGFIISERFVLTAAHCTYSPIGGYVTEIRIRTLKRSDNIEERNLYHVKRRYLHPKYKSPLMYNDIALLETDRNMELDRYALPSCLHDGRKINDDKAIVTGWGITTPGYNNKPSDILRKAQLEKFSDEDCDKSYNDIHKMPRGYHSETQICYGARHSRKDSCQGDSGGPIQIQHPTVECMYLASALISHGKYCGLAGSPGIYTRIAPYLDWIESIVWPDEL